MIASLPMYDRLETAEANDRLWASIRERLAYGPKTLLRDGNVWAHWQDADLVMSQTCGYPYRAKLADDVQLIGTPCYDIDCQSGYYFSVFVVRADDPRESLDDFANLRFAYNEPLSQSGWAAAQNHLAAAGLMFSDVIQSGAHVASAAMVAEGKADIAALDAVSWKMMKRWDDVAKNLRGLARTTPTPGLPYITAASRDASQIKTAVVEAIKAMSRQDREDLCLTGMTQISKAEYLAVQSPPSP